MIKYLIIISLIFSFAVSFAENLEMSIRFMGLKVVDVTMTDRRHKLYIQAKATGFGSIVSEMNNTYISEYESDYLPLSYSKSIYQKDYFEDRSTGYDRVIKKAQRISRISSDRNLEYGIHPEIRDFFSALYYIRFHWQDKKPLFLDADGTEWSAVCRFTGYEIINSKWGNLEAARLELSFTKLRSRKSQRSDMLTNNLVNEDNMLILWIGNDDNRLPLKAKYNMNPFNVYWMLEKYDQD